MKMLFGSRLIPILGFTLCLPAMALPPRIESVTQDLTPGQVFNKVQASIVVVKTEVAQGSGVKLPSGRIVTNFHVIEKGTSILVGREGRFSPARIIVLDAEKDLCLLEVPDLKTTSITLGHTSTLKVGAPVYAVGSPQGLELSISNGIVSQLRGGVPPIIQTTASISPGSSGGGLFDAKGNLIGITTFKWKDGENLNFAVPVEWIEQIEVSKPQLATTRTLSGWMSYQTEMEQALEQLKILVNERKGTVNEKLEALQKAEVKWTENNPYSDKDEQARSWIKDQIAELRIKQSKAVARQAKKTLSPQGFASWRAEEYENLAPLLDGAEKAKAYLKWLSTGLGSIGDTEKHTLGETWKDENSQIIFVWIPAGQFTMGSGGWGKSFGNPQHEVIISHGFWMGKSEITQGQYQAVMGLNPSQFSNEGSNAPVERVSWNDAQIYMSKLNEQAGENRFRLPTEAEWEYACQGRLDSGSPDSSAWYYSNSGNRTHPVAQQTPNGWGLYDMLGNVWEWCQDCWSDYPNGTVTDPIAPTGPSCSIRVIRGGSWQDRYRYCHPTYRYSEYPETRSSTIGFRVVAVAEP